MVYIKPWSKESERILYQLTKNGKAFCFDTKMPSDFGRRCKDIINKDFLDIATTKYRTKKWKTIFVTPPDTIVVPQKGKFFFYKI